MKMMFNWLLCRLGSHFWVDEPEVKGPGLIVRATCCWKAKSLKPSADDWELVETYAPQNKPFVDGLRVQAVSQSRLNPNWWKRHMKWQRWSQCHFATNRGRCIMPCAEAKALCNFHHEHCVVHQHIPLTVSQH